MDFDFELIIYIIFVLVAILSRVFKKPKNQAPAEPESESESQPTVTFEDLLKEFQQRRQPAREEVKVEKPAEQDYEFQQDTPSDSEIQEVYEASIRQAENAKRAGEAEKSGIQFAPFEVFEEEVKENTMAREIKEMLSNPDSAAKAIVLGEIINRKY